MNLKGYQFPQDVILETICYYLAYKLSYREIEEIQTERGIKGLPEKVVIDGSNANHAALDAMNVQLWLTGYFMLCLIEICNAKYLNNIVEQSHRWVKQKTRQALGWKSVF